MSLGFPVIAGWKPARAKYPGNVKINLRILPAQIPNLLGIAQMYPLIKSK